MKKHWPVIVFLSIFFVLIAGKLIFNPTPFFDWDESLYVQTGKEMIEQNKFLFSVSVTGPKMRILFRNPLLIELSVTEDASVPQPAMIS